MYTRQQIEHAVKVKGYSWFESNKDFDVNIVGIRNTTTQNKVTNRFDDTMTLSYKINGVWQFHQWICTTDPGITYTTQRLLSPLGVARLVPNQYRGAYQIGLHQGKYEALVQRKPVKVYRDANKDLKFDETKIEEGLFGINIHRSSPTGVSTVIEGWSAGCQVFSNIRDFRQFMQIMNRAKDVFGNNFTYTLIESKDIV
jgi:hypothetical protein